MQLSEGVRILWDDRFSVLLKKNLCIETKIASLTSLGWNKLIKLDKKIKNNGMPYHAKTVLPAIWGDEDLIAVPHIGYYNPDFLDLSSGLEIKWMPRVSVGSARFGLRKF